MVYKRYYLRVRITSSNYDGQFKEDYLIPMFYRTREDAEAAIKGVYAKSFVLTKIFSYDEQKLRYEVKGDRSLNSIQFMVDEIEFNDEEK